MLNRIAFACAGVTSALVCLAVVTAFAEEARRLTIQEAVGIALSENPNVQAVRQEVAAAQARIAIARSAGQLQIRAVAEYTRTTATGTFTIPRLFPDIPEQEVATFAEENVIGTVEGRLAVYTGGGIPARIDSAVALFDSALGRLRAVESETALQVREAYYSLLLGGSLVESAEKDLEAARQQLNSATARFETGTAARFDVLRAQTLVSEAEQNLVEARNQNQLARVAFNKVVGVPLGQTFELAEPGSAPFPEEDTQALVETALKQRPELLTARAELAAAEAGVCVARSDRRPELGLSARYQTVSKESPAQAQGLTLMATASLEIFDGGRISAAISEAKSLRDQAEFRLQETIRTIELDVRQAYLNLDTARQTLGTAEARRAQAEEAYEVARVRYEAGVGTIVEMADALASLTAARANLDRARFSYSAAYARLQRALGETV